MAAANPIQIVPLHADGLAAAVSRVQLTCRGGPLLPAVQVCAWQTKRLGACIVQLESSNRSGKCI